MAPDSIRAPVARALSDETMIELCIIQRTAFRNVQARMASQQLGECFGNIEWLEPRHVIPQQHKEAA